MLKGFVLGTTSLIPGISAGTLALIMGIYEKIIFSITNLFSFSKNNQKKAGFSFLLCLTIGFLLAIGALAKGISWLLSTFPLELYSVFTGLIIASLPKLFKMTDKTKQSFFLVSIISVVFFIFLKKIPNLSHPQASLFLFFISGFFGFFASALPGLSGSTVLLIMGTYQLILKALTEGEGGYFIIFLIGGMAGLSCAFYFIRFFLKKKKNLFFCIILGLIIGSLPEIAPWKQEHSLSTSTLLIRIITCIFMGIILFLLAEKPIFWKKTKVQN